MKTSSWLFFHSQHLYNHSQQICHADTVEVDYLSRSNVLYEEKCIFEYDGAGFNETVYWDIEWISEDEIRIYVYGDRWTEVKQSVVQQRCHNSI